MQSSVLTLYRVRHLNNMKSDYCFCDVLHLDVGDSVGYIRKEKSSRAVWNSWVLALVAVEDHHAPYIYRLYRLQASLASMFSLCLYPQLWDHLLNDTSQHSDISMFGHYIVTIRLKQQACNRGISPKPTWRKCQLYQTNRTHIQYYVDL